MLTLMNALKNWDGYQVIVFSARFALLMLRNFVKGKKYVGCSDSHNTWWSPPFSLFHVWKFCPFINYPRILFGFFSSSSSPLHFSNGIFFFKNKQELRKSFWKDKLSKCKRVENTTLRTMAWTGAFYLSNRVKEWRRGGSWRPFQFWRHLLKLPAQLICFLLQLDPNRHLICFYLIRPTLNWCVLVFGRLRLGTCMPRQHKMWWCCIPR